MSLQAEPEANRELDLTIALYRISQQMIAPQKKSLPKKMDFYQKLMNHAKEAEVAYPLSDEVVNLLGGYGYGYVGSEDGNEGKRLVEALKELISTSDKVWEGMMRVLC